MTLGPKRVVPTAVAAVLALAYVIVSPPSLDLAAHLFRAKLFGAEGFGLWNNWWYSGHHVPGYSVLFPPAAWLLTPQVAGALAAVATAALFESLAWRQFGEQAWLGALWFGAATATDLFTGRLTFAFGLLPAVATAVALQRRRPVVGATLAVLTALASPVAALFAALAGAAYAIGRLIGDHDRRAVAAGAGVVVAALVPVLILAVAFPEGGTEPFTFPVLWPILLIAGFSLAALPKDALVLRTGIVLYVLGCLGSYAVPSPVGSNASRLAPLLAGPLAALLWWRRRTAWLLAVALPLLYIQWQAPVRDVRTSANDPSDKAAYWKPLLSFLSRQGGPPFRVEVPFTQFHFEAYHLAPRFPIARGWERQVDIEDNHLFYDSVLTAARYEQWLHQVAVRFVAVADVHLDYAGRQENALIARGLPYLRPVMRSAHWQVYAVRAPTPIVSGAGTLRAVGPNSLSLLATRPGRALVRVHFTPYWALGQGSGCVSPAGEFTALTLQHPGPVKLVISFAPGRIGARSARCS